MAETTRTYSSNRANVLRPITCNAL